MSRHAVVSDHELHKLYTVIRRVFLKEHLASASAPSTPLAHPATKEPKSNKKKWILLIVATVTVCLLAILLFTRKKKL